jgi:O-antigen/teichoic acid export membrane protein
MLLKNAVIRTITGILIILIGIVTTPMMISILGETSYGFWMLMMSIEALTSFIDIGLGVALSRSLSANLSSNNENSIGKLISASLTLHLIVSGIVLAIYTILFFWIDSLFNVDVEHLANARIVLVLFSFASFFKFAMRTFDGIIMSKGQHYIFSIIELVGNSGRLCCLYVFMKIGANVIYIASMHIIILIMSCLFSYLFAKRLIGGINILHYQWNPSQIRELSIYCRDFSLSMFGSTIRNMMPITILGRVGDLASVAQYGVGKRLGFMGLSLSLQIFEPAMVKFTSLLSSKEYDQAQKLFCWTSLYAALTGGYICLGMILFSNEFIDLWIGPKFQLAANLTQIITVGIAIMIVMHPCSLVLQSLAKHRITGIVDTVEAILLIVVLFIVSTRYGAVGVAYAFSGILFILRPWIFTRFACKNLNMKCIELIRKSYIRPIITVISVYITYSLINNQIIKSSWYHIITSAVIYTVIYMIIGFTMGLNSELRHYWVLKIHGIMYDNKSHLPKIK